MGAKAIVEGVLIIDLNGEGDEWVLMLRAESRQPQ